MNQIKPFNRLPRKKQRGAALLVFFLVVLISGVLYLVGRVALDRGSVAYEASTSEALAAAKQALIAYAVAFYPQGHEGLYGFLPCPETQAAGSEGISQGNCTAQYFNAIGRLPWKTLGIAPLKDGSGECLWYAVSGDYKFGSTPGPRSAMHNADSPGMLALFDENLNIIKGTLPEDRVVAIIIAPGPQLPGQNRPAASSALPCKVARVVADPLAYLESVGIYFNSDVSASADTVDYFVTAKNLQGSTINDRIMTITVGDIFSAIKNQASFAARMDNLTEGLTRCIAAYGIANMQAGGGGGCVTCADCYATNGCVSCRGLGGWARRDCNRCQRSCRRGGCQATCPGGGGSDIYRLPWPAPVDLLADYRDSLNYNDIAAGQVATEGLLGRYPFLIDDSNAQVSIQLGTPVASSNTFLDDCTAINVAGGSISIDFSNPNDEYRRLYEHWKDHFFYVLGAAYAPTTSNSACGNCPSSQPDAANPYAAIVFYAADRISGLNQLRRNLQTDAGTPAVETKAEISNYLEGQNSANYADTNGTGIYNVATPLANDRYCLIDDDATLTVSCP